MPQVSCHKCQSVQDLLKPYSRRAECSACGSDLHVCLCCENYSEGSNKSCKEPISEEVREKDRANFCDYFGPVVKAGSATRKEDLLAAAEALFKK